MFYEIIRKLLCPFGEIEKFVPDSGKILDVGCGHGTFARILSRGHYNRKILGIDPSGHKIALAKKYSNGFKNVKFEKKYLSQVRGKYDCILFIDVLYLFPDSEKLERLKEANKVLKKGGSLLVKTSSTEPKILFKLLQLEETIMVKILGYTYSDRKAFYFSTIKKHKNIIQQAGFKLMNFSIFKSTFPYRHPTYVAQKTSQIN